MTSTIVDKVKEVVAETLGIEDRLATMDETTRLLGDLPEFDSMAVVAVIVALEERFGIEMDEADLTGDVFETLGALADFVASQQP